LIGFEGIKVERDVVSGGGRLRYLVIECSGIGGFRPGFGAIRELIATIIGW
jgi:hypothetical protein